MVLRGVDLVDNLLGVVRFFLELVVGLIVVGIEFIFIINWGGFLFLLLLRKWKKFCLVISWFKIVIFFFFYFYDVVGIFWGVDLFLVYINIILIIELYWYGNWVLD